MDTPHATVGLTCWKVTAIVKAFLFFAESCANDEKIWSDLFIAYILLTHVLTELHNFKANGPARLRGQHSHLVGLSLFAIR
jgi:hypothetical protein